MKCEDCKYYTDFLSYCKDADKLAYEAIDKRICRYKLSDIRDQIVFGKKTEELDYIGGMERFDELKLSQIEQLLENNIIDLDDRQNNAPTAGELINFVKKHPEYNLFGYCITPDRDDFRITFDGIGGPEGVDTTDFMHFECNADEFILNPPYAWWD